MLPEIGHQLRRQTSATDGLLLKANCGLEVARFGVGCSKGVDVAGVFPQPERARSFRIVDCLLRIAKSRIWTSSANPCEMVERRRISGPFRLQTDNVLRFGDAFG